MTVPGPRQCAQIHNASASTSCKPHAGWKAKNERHSRHLAPSPGPIPNISICALWASGRDETVRFFRQPLIRPLCINETVCVCVCLSFSLLVLVLHLLLHVLLLLLLLLLEGLEKRTPLTKVATASPYHKNSKELIQEYIRCTENKVVSGQVSL